MRVVQVSCFDTRHTKDFGFWDPVGQIHFVIVPRFNNLLIIISVKSVYNQDERRLECMYC